MVAAARSILGANRHYHLMCPRMQTPFDRDADDHATSISHRVEALQLAKEMGLPGEVRQISAELAASCAAREDVEHEVEARGRERAGLYRAVEPQP
jgi:hypothetical protein